jgi:hypothetical protein
MIRRVAFKSRCMLIARNGSQNTPQFSIRRHAFSEQKPPLNESTKVVHIIPADEAKVDSTHLNAIPSESVGRNSNDVFTIPNLITGGRLLVTPAISYLLFTEQWDLALVSLTAAGASDWLDGYISLFSCLACRLL